MTSLITTLCLAIMFTLWNRSLEKKIARLEKHCGIEETEDWYIR